MTAQLWWEKTFSCLQCTKVISISWLTFNKLLHIAILRRLLRISVVQTAGWGAKRMNEYGIIMKDISWMMEEGMSKLWNISIGQPRQTTGEWQGERRGLCPRAPWGFGYLQGEMEHPVWESAVAQDHITFRGYLSLNTHHRQARHTTQWSTTAPHALLTTSSKAATATKTTGLWHLHTGCLLRLVECNLQRSVNKNCQLQSNITNATD